MYVISVVIQPKEIDIFSTVSGNKLPSFRVCLVGVKTKKLENRVRKIGWKMTIFTVLFKRKNKREKIGRKIIPPDSLFLSSQFGRKIGRKNC